MSLLLALALSVLAAALPTAVYVSIAWWLDRYEKEPLWLLAVTFVWGAVPAVVLALLSQVSSGALLHAVLGDQAVVWVETVVLAPLTEEVFKGVPLLLIFLLHRREFDGLMDGLLYGAVVGFGFAMVENILYFLGAWSEGGFPALAVTAVLRVVVFGLNHALFTSMFGLGLAVARYSRPGPLRWFAPTAGLALGITLHAAHNFFVSTESLWAVMSLVTDYTGVLVWLGLMLAAGVQESRWIREELAEEVASGLLPAETAWAAGSMRARSRARWEALHSHGVARFHALGGLYSLAADLAFKKRQLRLHGDEHGYAAEVIRLREQIRGLILGGAG